MTVTRVPLKGPVEPGREDKGTPTSETLPDGQAKDHWILSDEERAKGFIRPVRASYRHVGLPRPRFELRDLTPEEHERYDKFAYVKFEPYPPGGACVGRYWTQAQLESRGCGVVTSMPRKIAETYAAQPDYYGSTFCCGCGKYLPVGDFGEFVWEGTLERVGT